LRQKALKKGIKRKIKITQAEKLYYIRYGDDFILGYNGNKQKFKKILTDIQNFIKSNLHLNTGDLNIKNALSDKTPFLGFKLKVSLIKKKLKDDNTLQQFQKLRLITVIKKKNEYNKYIRLLE
jgi:hypothetical protein